MIGKLNLQTRLVAIASVALVTVGCSAAFLKDCPKGEVLGHDETHQPRMRSSSVRVVLGNIQAVGERFSDYAAMSALAYVDLQDSGCAYPASKIDSADRTALEDHLKARGWKPLEDENLIMQCQDETGFFYRVWEREQTRESLRREVVVAFRGTEGFKDWWYGNFYWFRRFFTDNHQYTLARSTAATIVQAIHSQASPEHNVEFSATGHSLGGGLAQGVLYDQHSNTPWFDQVYAFDPSSATAYTSRIDESPLKNCPCNGREPEPRIFRIYESGEILAFQRIFHKMFFPPEPWINEVRLAYSDRHNPDHKPNAIQQHGMVPLAIELINDTPKEPNTELPVPWYSSAHPECTGPFEESLKKVCPACLSPESQ